MTDTNTQAEREKLAPCPFCGESNTRVNYIRDGYRIGCNNCGAAGGARHHGKITDPPAEVRAAEAWNRRTLSFPPAGQGEPSDAEAARAWLRKRWSQDWPNEGHVKQLADYAAHLRALPQPNTGGEVESVRADATRYRYLRDRDPGPDGAPPPAGLFVGRVPENLILTGEHADSAIDDALSQTSGTGAKP